MATSQPQSRSDLLLESTRPLPRVDPITQLPILILFPQPLNWTALLVIPAIGLFVLNAVWVTIVFGVLSTRFRDIGELGFWAMMIFLAELALGFVYVWRKGALEWD